MPGPCPRTITITIHKGNISVYPSSANIDTDCQQIQWNLVSDPSGSFRTPAIVFPWPVPPSAPPAPCSGGYSRWRGTVTQTGPMQYEGDATEPLPSGAPALCYKYNVNWEKGGVPQTFDPDIKNDPYPPGSDDDENGPGRGHGHGHDKK